MITDTEISEESIELAIQQHFDQEVEDYRQVGELMTKSLPTESEWNTILGFTGEYDYE